MYVRVPVEVGMAEGVGAVVGAAVAANGLVVSVGSAEAGAVELTDCGLSSPESPQASPRNAIIPRTGRIQNRNIECP